MRSAGLCFAVIFLVAACDDAGGAGYMPGGSPPVRDELNVPTPSERAMALGTSAEIDYACGEDDRPAHVTLFGAEEMAGVLIPGTVDVPLYLDCSPTRAGPECTAGTFRALINTVADRVEFSDSVTGDGLSCVALQSE